MSNLDPTKSAIHSGTEIVSKKKAEYKFLGAGHKPHRGMFLYALDKDNGIVYNIPIVPKEEILFPNNPTQKAKTVAKSKVHINPNHPVVWKINMSNAVKYFEKRYNRKFSFIK